jgi:glutathione S-transferase
MILVGQYDSPFVRRIGFALHWYGMPFERNTMSVFGDADRMRTINPLGRIPSLILSGGETLIDSWAIHDYLDEIAPPARRLTPASGAERRKALHLTAVAAGAVDKAGAIVYENTLRPPEKRHAPWIERCETQLKTALAYLNAAAAGGDWLTGKQISQADVMLGATAWYVGARVPGVALKMQAPAIQRHYDRMLTLTEFRLTSPAEDEAMPSQL